MYVDIIFRNKIVVVLGIQEILFLAMLLNKHKSECI